jgi:hypothetical protein
MSRTKQKSVPVSDEVITPINHQPQILPLGTAMKLVRVDVLVTDEFLEVLTELAKIKQSDLRRYIDQAVHTTVKNDLDTPSEIGLEVCRNLKEIIHPAGT